MKKLFFTLLFFIPVIAFPQWYWQNPLPQGNCLLNVFFIDSLNGYFAGYSGTILKTTDGGTTWSIYSSGPKNTCYSIFFTDDDTGYIAGTVDTMEMILKTNDAGSTWNTVYSGTGDRLTSIYFPSNNIGYAVGYYGKILKTTDAGYTWTQQSSNTIDDLNSVYFINSDTGYAIGDDYNAGIGIILKTTNGGLVWNDIKNIWTENMSSIYFSNADTGFIVGWGETPLRTTNGGTTWTIDTNGLGMQGYNANFTSVFFVNSNKGYIGDLTGSIYKTTNAGGTWVLQSIFLISSIESMYFTSTNIGYAVGGPEMIKTINAGSSWDSLTSGLMPDYFCSVNFPTVNTGYVLNSRGPIMKTSNGGVNWSYSYYNYGCIEGKSIFFTSSSVGYVVGIEGVLAKTTDGADTWTMIQIGTNMDLNSVFFLNMNTGYIVGGLQSQPTQCGIVLKTLDGGTTWAQTLLNYYLYSVYFPSSTIGYAAGMDSSNQSGIVAKTIDGGTTWQKLLVIPCDLLVSIFFTDDNTGYVVGTNGANLKTIDGGATWTSMNIYNGWWNFNSVFFITPSKGYIVDEWGDIFYTTDAGSTWTADSSGTGNGLYSVFFTDSTTGYAVGNNCTILKTGYGGVTSIKEKQPNAQKFIIYPNPSNNEITVETSSTPAISQLSIINLNGQQLITRQITELRTQIDISSLPSGVYFVRLTNDKTVEVGKFIKE
jgi:photosystem II stability/assembly factor-like uncharacterized protein